MLLTFAHKCKQTISTISAALALTGAMGLLLATAITCVSIVLRLVRRVLDASLSSLIDPTYWSWLGPILGEEELVRFAVGMALFAALPWVMLNRGHIRVELLQSRFGERFNQWLDLCADLAMTTLAWLIMTRQWGLLFKRPRRGQNTLSDWLLSGEFQRIAERMRMNQESQILGIPMWPLYLFAELCVVLFFIVSVYCVVRSAVRLWQPGNRSQP